MGNINLCKGHNQRSSSRSKSKNSAYVNKLIQEVELDKYEINIQLYRGYCAYDKSDVTVNVSDEYISRSGNNQEIMLFNTAGEELRKETIQYIKKNQSLHHKLPFYTHAGNLKVSNVIHCTLSDNKRIINDDSIEQTFVECLQIADQELEAESISFPMIYLRNYSLKGISRIMVRSIKQYLENHRSTNNQHLKTIKFIGDETKLQLAYINTIQEVFQDVVKTFCSPRINSQYQESDIDKSYSYDAKGLFLQSYKSENNQVKHYEQQQEIYYDD